VAILFSCSYHTALKKLTHSNPYIQSAVVTPSLADFSP